MYEASFALKRRPFAATPDATCLMASDPIRAALDELIVCVEQGQGIAVMTAPAGTGKTLVCERIRLELDERFETVFLRHASFLTRRALLQTILCELNANYNHPSEQELRLELLPAIRALQPKREALVLICDEAHQLSDSLLEELRILSDFAEAGRPLVRLVLVGQPSLEEKLTESSLEAFNQRIRSQVHLNSLDQSESRDYIDYRITWAGGRTNEVFTDEALDLIVRASDGIPRCLNQLADHSLLLAFVAEQHPVSVDLVHEALNDLRQLPLHWNEPVARSESTAAYGQEIGETSSHSDSIEFGHDNESTNLTHSAGSSYTYEPELDETVLRPFHLNVPPQAIGQFTSDSAHDVSRDTMNEDEWRLAINNFEQPKSQNNWSEVSDFPAAASLNIESTAKQFTRRIQFHDLLKDAYEAASSNQQNGDRTTDDCSDDEVGCDSIEILRQSLNALRDEPKFNKSYESSSSTATHSVPLEQFFQEEMILDRYTSIDAGLRPPEIPVSEPVVVEPTPTRFVQPELTNDWDRPQLAEQTAPTSFEYDGLHQMAQDVYSLADSMRPRGVLSSNSESLLEAIRQEVPDIQAASSVPMSITPPPIPEQATWESVETESREVRKPNRPFQFLFSKLRRKQQGL